MESLYSGVDLYCKIYVLKSDRGVHIHHALYSPRKQPLPPIPGTEVITFKLKEDPKEDPGYEVIADSFLTKADVDSGYVVAGSLNDPSNRTSQLYNRYTVTAEGKFQWLSYNDDNAMLQ